MLLRKRAWDIMREDFLTVATNAGLGEVLVRLRESIAKQADNDFAVVVREAGQLAGVLTMRDMLRVIQDCVLRDEIVRNAEEMDWDRAFARACDLCCNRTVSEIMDKKPLVVRPNEPILLVLNNLVESRFRWAVVEEGNRPIGVVVMGDLYNEISREMVALR